MAANAIDQAPSAIQKTARAPLAFIPANLDEAWRIADMLAKSGILPDALRGKPHDILVTVMTGTELGLSPMQSIRDISVVKGRGYVSSLLKVALVKQSPECEYFRCVESTASVATFVTRRKSEGETRFSFTIDEARSAGLAGRQQVAGKEPSNWDKYPALMLRRRCSGQLADEVYPDVVRGIGDSDDVRQAEPNTLNQAPATYAPPVPELEDAQVVAPTPPPAPVKADGSSPVETKPSREPGDDDGKPSVETKAPKQQPVGIEPNGKAILDEVLAVDANDPVAQKKLDDISEVARQVQGPMRAEISKAMQEKRKSINAMRSAK